MFSFLARALERGVVLMEGSSCPPPTRWGSLGFALSGFCAAFVSSLTCLTPVWQQRSVWAEQCEVGSSCADFICTSGQGAAVSQIWQSNTGTFYLHSRVHFNVVCLPTSWHLTQKKLSELGIFFSPSLFSVLVYGSFPQYTLLHITKIYIF